MYLIEGYWGGVIDGRLVTYFCPSHYCQCVTQGDLPGCVFNPAHIDEQCAHNRTGVLCGKCKKGLSVGLRSVVLYNLLSNPRREGQGGRTGTGLLFSLVPTGFSGVLV